MILNSILQKQINCSRTLSFIYQYGSTLDVNNRQSNVVLSSGSTSFPTSQPVAAFHETKLNEFVSEIFELFSFFSSELQKKKGRVCVVGSVSMFHDAYIDKEENGKIFVSCFSQNTLSKNFLVSRTLSWNTLSTVSI